MAQMLGMDIPGMGYIIPAISCGPHQGTNGLLLNQFLRCRSRNNWISGSQIDAQVGLKIGHTQRPSSLRMRVTVNSDLDGSNVGSLILAKI